MRSLNDLLDLETLDANLFRSQRHEINFGGNLFGGQVLGQALIAAQATVDEQHRLPHSMHGYFLRAGTNSVPVIYEVERIRDGGSFTTRRVVAIQHGKAIFNMAISFHGEEPGLSHQVDAIEMPPLPTEQDSIELKARLQAMGFEAKLVDRLQDNSPITVMPVYQEAFLTEQLSRPNNLLWFRCPEQLPADQTIQRAALAFASDINLVATSLFPHPTSIFSGKQMIASLDHAVWFHSAPDVNEWLLYQADSPWAGGGRGFARGLIYNSTGKLVASTTQEGLIRPINAKPQT